MFHLRTGSRMIRNDAFPRKQDCVTIVLYGPLRFPPRHQPSLIFFSHWSSCTPPMSRLQLYRRAFRQRDCQRTTATNNYKQGRAKSENTPTREKPTEQSRC